MKEYRLKGCYKKFEAAYRELNKEKLKRYVSDWQKKRVKSMPDAYIKMLLCRNSTLSRQDTPQELVEVKRLHLKIKRLIKEQKDGKRKVG